MGLPKSNQGHNSIFVVVARFFKITHVIPCSKTIEASCLTKLLASNKDIKFVNYFWNTLQRIFGTYEILLACHPQTNGQSEVVQCSLEDLLKSLVREKQGNWDSMLPSIEFAYNNLVNI